MMRVASALLPLMTLAAVLRLQTAMAGPEAPPFDVRFVDVTAQTGITFKHENAPTTRKYLIETMGGGVALLDYDNDGWLDLLMVSGAVTSIEDLMKANDPFPLRQRKQLLRNLGTGEFEDVTARAGAVFQQASVARGAAFGDLDNDGDTDVVVASNNGPVQLLINEIGSRNHWVGVRAVTAAGAGPAAPAHAVRDAVGARVGVTRANGSVVWRRARAEGSYASANDPRVLVGLGSSAASVKVRVAWPDGKSEEWADLPVDRYTTLQEGTGK